MNIHATLSTPPLSASGFFRNLRDESLTPLTHSTFIAVAESFFQLIDFDEP
jgi:hypothetical protein